LKFSFSDIGPEADYRKIIDYKDRGTDNGFYTYEDYIYFYELGEGSDAFGRYFSANEIIDLIIVRDGTTDRFTVYLRSAGGGLGDPVIDIDDSADNESVFSDSGLGSVIGLFYDDESTDGEGGPGGKAYQFTTWSGIALTVDQLNEFLGIQTASPDFDDYRLPQPTVAAETLPNTGSTTLVPLAALAGLLVSTGVAIALKSRRLDRI
jgi:LPXTG-motif cell wall-anchored protein